MRGLILPLLLLLAVSLPVAAQPQKQPEPVPADWYAGRFCGTVVSVGKDGLVIKPAGWLRLLVTDQRHDGTPRERVYLQDNSKPPRAFTFCDSLFPNRPGVKSARIGEHEIEDLRAGDFVEIGCNRIKDKEYCVSLQIQRRRGGTVPLAIGDGSLEVKNRFSTRWNNEQRNEERAFAIAGRVLRNFGR